jgi:DNA repair exonuclease SbcCD nuclease subunit
MKILLTADWHFDCNNRLEDFVASTEKIVNYAIDHKLKHIFIVGDMYRNWKPSSAERMALHAVLAKAVFASIDVTIVMGNHDVNDKEQNFIQHALSEFVDIGSERIVLVYNEPKSQILRDGDKSYVVMLIPHLCKAYLRRKGPNGSTYKEAFRDVLKRSSAASLVLSHTLVMDGLDGPINPNDERGLMLSDFKDVLAAPMFMGDIHKHMVLQQDPIVAYISPPERTTFKHVDDQMGFVVYDLAEKSYEFVPLNTRKFFQIGIDLNKKEFSFHGVGEKVSAALGDGDRTELIVSIIKAAAEAMNDAVVKVVVTGHKQDLNLINRHAVIEHLKQCKPFKIVKVAFDSTDDTVARDTAFTGHMTAQDAFRMWSEKQTYADKELGVAIFDAGMEILNEA